jgi:hypothetical protein
MTESDATVKYKKMMEWLESIAAGKQVPCSVCGEPLVPIRGVKNGVLMGAKCPHGHEKFYPEMHGETFEGWPGFKDAKSKSKM